MELVMDHGWIMTYADPVSPSLPISLLLDKNGDVSKENLFFLSWEVDEVNMYYERGKANRFLIEYDLTDERWERALLVAGPEWSVAQFTNPYRISG
ncbi:hypothetical protein [Sphingobacterium suaedae]|uniref:Uncharacterized protein n=1 Tax=Sphingobacterium suaedae TaxID=1686402 RepID=A0ABW5KEY0_9SPHI